ncbi:MAG: hypothetical protein M3020_20090 [Myxococcota bacterium]|nr:hypothetical protein [Myxococcota bacterium]
MGEPVGAPVGVPLGWLGLLGAPGLLGLPGFEGVPVELGSAVAGSSGLVIVPVHPALTESVSAAKQKNFACI